MSNYIRKQQFGDSAHFLNGKHLVITGLETFVDYHAIRNESGFIYELRGLSGYTLPWLSKYFNFTYSPLQTPPLPLDPVGQKPGIVSVVTEGICDIAGTISATSGRGAILDFTQPYVYIPISYLIRAPESSANYLAILEPFSTWVWVGLVLAALVVLFFLCIFTWFPSSLLMNLKKEVIPKRAIKVSNYVVRILLKQAGYYPLSKATSILIVAGVWGLAIFLLSNYYTTLLISYVAAPNPQPIIRSIYELRNRPDLRLVTDKNINFETIILNAESGFYKLLGDKLREFPDSSCNDTMKCAEMVKTGNVVYASGKDSFLYKAINVDFKATGKCNFELGKENLLEVGLCWAGKKRNPAVPLFDYGLMRMREAGLLIYWYKKGLADVHKCVQTKSKGPVDQMEPLSLNGLTGAFFVLLFGYIIAIIWLLAEKIYHFSLSKQK